MELKSFREVLLKKADGNPRLEILVECITQDRLADEVIESLRKMAQLTHAASRNPNSALLHYAKNMSDTDVHQIRDALGHHISHYRGALKTMQAAKDKPEQDRLRGVADQHLNKIVPLAHMAAKAGHHSEGTIAADLPPIRAWEANYTGAGPKHRFSTTKTPIAEGEHKGKVEDVDPLSGRARRGRPGVEFEGTQGWNRRLPSGKSKDADQSKSRSVHNYRYLEMPPHGQHESLKETNHRGGFPFEDIRVGSGTDVGSGGGHLPIEDVGEVKDYVPHEFDEHPIHGVFDEPESNISPEDRESFVNNVGSWEDTPHFQKWAARHGEMNDKDPEAYAKRGSEKPGHVYKDLSLLPQPAHATEGMSAAEPQQDATSAEAAAPTAPSEKSKNTILKKPSATSKKASIQDPKAMWDSLNDEQKAGLAHLPEFAEFARKK
jgi:hypothetical protein